MATEYQQLPNPFPMLVAEERTGEVQAREALFLTFNVDLAFFEAQVLGTCLAAGARVAVIADGNVWAPDPRAVRHAGRSYNIGLVTGHAAFHPKIVILAGQERVQVAIGSGNLTLGGWQYNDEIWIQFKGDKTSHPAIFHQLADWLQSFAEFQWLDDDSRDSVRRTYTLLQRLIQQGQMVDTGHTFVTSADGPILDRLPGGPVSELHLYAPFLDSGMSAVAAIHKRFIPHQSSLLLQPRLTVFNPGEVQRCADRLGIDVQAEATDGRMKYRHGKMIWWRSDDTPAALIGSPNLSSAALLRGWFSGGNYETAVIGPASSLSVPTGEPMNADSLTPATTAATYPSSSLGTSIKSARAVGNELVITLSAPSPAHLELEASEYSDPPEHWDPLGWIEPGQSEVRFARELGAASRIRLRSLEDGIMVYGPTVFVMHPHMIRSAPRSVPSTKPYQSPTPSDVWADGGRALDYLAADFETLREASRRSSTSGIRAAGVSDGSGSAPRPAEKLNVESPWLWELETATHIQGPQMTAFVLGMPAPAISVRADAVAPRWEDVLVDDDEAVLDDEGDDAQSDIVSEDVSEREQRIPDHSKSSEVDRRRRRRRSVDWVENIDDQPPFIQLAILRIVTSFYSAGNWDPGASEPLRLISTIIKSMSRELSPDELRPSMASMALVSCAVIRSATDPRTTSEPTIIYRSVLQSAAAFVEDFDEGLATEYCRTLVGRDSQTLRLDHVQHLIECDLAGDEFQEARAASVSVGWDFISQGRNRIYIHGKFSNPELAAITVAGWMNRDESPPIWAINQYGNWCLCIWQRPHLIIADGTGTRPIWKHFRLASHMSPAAFANQRRSDDSYSAGKQKIARPWIPFPEAERAIDHWNLAGPAPPPHRQ